MSSGDGVEMCCCAAESGSKKLRVFCAAQVGQMSSLFDSAGYSAAGIWRRRLWAIALLNVLPSANEGVVRNLDQVGPRGMRHENVSGCAASRDPPVRFDAWTGEALVAIGLPCPSASVCWPGPSPLVPYRSRSSGWHLDEQGEMSVAPGNRGRSLKALCAHRRDHPPLLRKLWQWF